MVHLKFIKLLCHHTSFRHIARQSQRFFSKTLQVEIKESTLRKFINKRRTFNAYVSFADDSNKIARSSKIAFWGLNILFCAPSVLMILTPPASVHQSLSAHQFKMSAVSLVWSVAGIMGFHNGAYASFGGGRLLTKSRTIFSLGITLGSVTSLIMADYDLTKGYILQTLLQGVITIYNFILSLGKTLPPIVAKMNMSMATLHVCGLALGYCIATRSKYNNESNEMIIECFEAKH